MKHSKQPPSHRSMSDSTTDSVEQDTATEVETDATTGAPEVSFSERYSDILS